MREAYKLQIITAIVQRVPNSAVGRARTRHLRAAEQRDVGSIRHPSSAGIFRIGRKCKDATELCLQSFDFHFLVSVRRNVPSSARCPLLNRRDYSPPAENPMIITFKAYTSLFVADTSDFCNAIVLPVSCSRMSPKSISRHILSLAPQIPLKIAS